MKNKNLLQLFLLFCISFSLKADEIYTVDELIFLALKNSPDLKISGLNYEASQQEYNIATANYLPKVNLQASAAKAGASNILSTNNDMVDDTILRGNVSLKQLIYDFGKTGSNSDYTQYESQSYLLKQIQKISNKKRAVKEAYYNVLKAKSLISVQIENVKLNQAQLYRSKQYFKAGIRTKIDISDAKVALIKSQIDLKNAQYNLKQAYSILDQVVGFTDVDKLYTVYSTNLNLNRLNDFVKDYPLTLKNCIRYAYENKPEIKEYQTNIKSVESLIKVSSSEYYPELYLGADYTKQSSDKFQLLTPKDQWQVGVNLNWNLYQGGSSKSRVQKSKINREISTFALRDLKLKVKQNVTSEFLNVYRKKDTLGLSQGLMEASSQKFDQAAKRYEHGLSDYIELQQARQDYIDAKASLIIDYYNYYIAIANLDNAIGK